MLILNTGTEGSASRCRVAISQFYFCLLCLGASPVRFGPITNLVRLPSRIICMIRRPHVYLQVIGRLLLSVCPKWPHFRKSPDLFGHSPLLIYLYSMLDTAAPLLQQDLRVGNKGLDQGSKAVVDFLTHQYCWPCLCKLLRVCCLHE